MSELESGKELSKSINGFGYQAYIVGGAVRDIAMGHTNPADVDIATNMPIEKLKQFFDKTYSIGTGERHGTVLIPFNGYHFEVTQFRKDGEYTDGRRPDSVEMTDSFKEDTARRDLTINAIGLDSSGEFIDFHGGVADIESMIIRTVGSPIDRLSEDPLRIIRALRFTALTSFDIEEKTENAIRSLVVNLTSVSRERIMDEVRKTMKYGNEVFTRFLELIKEFDAWTIVFTGVAYNGEIIESTKYLKDKDYVTALAIMSLNSKLDKKSLIDTWKLSSEDASAIVYIIESMKALKNKPSTTDLLYIIKKKNMHRKKHYMRLICVYVFVEGVNYSSINVDKMIYIGILDTVLLKKVITAQVMEEGSTGADISSEVTKRLETYITIATTLHMGY
jgi:tRNA nucleotidyltransferase/poly(A) polymerase